MPTRALALLALGYLLGPPCDVRAQPPVLVRADTRIELRVDRREDGQVHLIGTLRDDLGAIVAGVPIDVAAWRERGEGEARVRWNAHPHTDATGSFDVLFEAQDGWWASASFAGTELFLATEARQRLDLTLEHVSLTVHVDSAGVLNLDQQEHTVRIETESAAGGADLDISLRNELGVNLAEGRTDLDGSVVLTVPSELLGPPSAGRLVALSAADAVRSAAQAEVPIVRLRPTRLSLSLEARTENTLRFEGSLQDSSGPRPREAIGLYAGDRHLGTAATDEQGRYELLIPLNEMAGLGAEVAVRARYSSDAPWIGASESSSVLVSFRPALLDGSALVGGASLAIALLVLGLLAWAGRNRKTEVVAPSDPSQSSIVLGQRGRARIQAVSGRIEDARTQRPIAHARVQVGELETQSDLEGRFRLAPNSARVALAIQADGYGPFETSVVIPHRGEHSGMQIRLVNHRDLALAPLRPIAMRLLPSAELWSLWTQRELLSALRKAGREPPELGELIDRVERACYGTESPDPEELAAIRALAARIEAPPPASPQER